MIKNSPTEAALTSLWTAVLGTVPPSPDASFFEHGGNSLKALRLMGRVRSRYGTSVALHDLFDNPTVRGLAARIDELQTTGRTKEDASYD